IGAGAITDDLSVNPRATFLRGFELFENQDSRALADNKTVAIALERSRGVQWIVVVGRQRSHGRKARDTHRRDSRLCAAADHDVCVAALNDLEAVADRMCACSTGSRGR